MVGESPAVITRDPRCPTADNPGRGPFLVSFLVVVLDWVTFFICSVFREPEERVVELKAGMRLRSATDTTEVIVVKSPTESIDLRCGGLAFEALDGEAGAPSPIAEGFEGGTQVGKRYADEEAGLEVLCTKGGSASISIGTEVLAPKGAKALPASD
jgi:hypothetical protein